MKSILIDNKEEIQPLLQILMCHTIKLKHQKIVKLNRTVDLKKNKAKEIY